MTGLSLDATTLPELAFTVEGADVVAHAAAPMLSFRVRIDSSGARVRSIALNVQIRLDVTRRIYSDAEEARLAELFGPPERWGDTLRSLLWTNVHVAVGAFDDVTVAEVQVPCTYDFAVANAKYFDALSDGEAPVELLFSGTVFYASEGLLRVAHIPWDREAQFRLPVRLWREAMERHFPGMAWLRLDKGTFDRLFAYRTRETLPSWEATIESLLDAAGEGKA